jgi:hypothetical protein
MARSAVIHVERRELVERRNEILARVGVSASELKARAERYELTPEEWAALEELREIAFLLGE